jgi:hypothetical protein
MYCWTDETTSRANTVGLVLHQKRKQVGFHVKSGSLGGAKALSN